MTTSLPVSILRAALGPPDAVPAEQPVHTRHQTLPFGALTWENFERLCHRLMALDGNVEYCDRFGQQGEAQAGIDIYARLQEGSYHCLQAKRHRKFSVTQLAGAVSSFLAGAWAGRAKYFTIALQSPFRSARQQEEVEKQATRLAKRGIVLVVLDGESMTERLRVHPMLVDDFFGRPWVVALLGHSAAESLGGRLDGAEFAHLRQQLAKVYEADFHFVDPGSFGSVSDESGRPELSLLERFLTPDIVVRETLQQRVPLMTGNAAPKPLAGAGDALGDSAAPPNAIGTMDSVATGRTRRLPFSEWCGEAQRLVLLGEAGCGKSTCLRVIALDLLHHQQHFPALAERWGKHIPLYIPFALWSSQVERDSSTIGIKEIVRRSLQQQLVNGTALLELLDRAISEQRVLLLVDGLDEWGSVQAARTTLRTLVTAAEAHNLPVMVSGRPRGLESIGVLPATWKRGTVAPLSVAQQGIIARRWFDRYSTADAMPATASVSALRTERFMAELARDANLQALASVPLLLIGLVTLTLRGQILPRTRNDMYDQLIRILLEVHPDRRATAAGDTSPRFRHAKDAAQRRAAIGKLAFIVRQQSGGAGLLHRKAREILAAYLAAPEGCDLPTGEAVAAAEEMLSVNAETQGLIVEKAPGEVGFVHASFEEYLGAEYISGWSFVDIQAFVDRHAGESRWRNVIANLMGHIQRRGEFDQLVTTIEAHGPDALARYQRQFLLGDIAFGPALRWTSTAKRLAQATLARVETAQWLPARQEALSSVLKGLGDETLKADIEQRVARWLPACNGYERAALVRVMGGWSATVELQDLLLQAMYDEDRSVQRAAAAAYSAAFAPSVAAAQRLLNQLAETLDATTAVALLESLALGWAAMPQARHLFDVAQHSQDAELRLVGILGHAANGILSEASCDAVLQSQSMWSGISYQYRELATSMLFKYWLGNEKLIKLALQRLAHERHTLWEYDGAVEFLLHSPTSHAAVRDWIIAEFEQNNYTFSSLRPHIWSQLGRFAAADPAVRSAANTFWCDRQRRLGMINQLPDYVALVADPELATLLTEILLTKEPNIDRYWALNALLTGWGRENPLAKSAIDTLANGDDDDLEEVLPFMAEIMGDKGIARARLLRMSTRPGLRRDLLAVGFEKCGCDGTDDEVVAAILAHPVTRSSFSNPSHVLLRSFSTHSRVRAMAVDLVRNARGYLAAIATAYPRDPAYAEQLYAALLPLRVELRTQIIELANAGATGTILESVLARTASESDPELRVRMAIGYYSSLAPAAYPQAKQQLLAQAVAIGPDYETARASALVGLMIIGELPALATLEERGKPVALETGRYSEIIPSVARLVCERLAELESVFGADLANRFKHLGTSERLADIVSGAPGASATAKSRFMSMAEQGNIPRTPDVLRTLATELPGSALLRARCLEALDASVRDNSAVMSNADIAVILREHFPHDASLRQRLTERYQNEQSIETAITLAVYAPDAQELPFTTNFEALGREVGDWAVAVWLGAWRTDSSTFCRLLTAMVGRGWRTQFDAQHIINLAVEERLAKDTELESLLCAQISEHVHPSVVGSFARYLAAAGRLGVTARDQACALLDTLEREQRLPVIGYDAIIGQKRALRLTLLDTLASGLEYA